MKRLIYLNLCAVALLFSGFAFGQSSLGMGDLALIHYRAGNQTANALGFISRTYIESGTEVYISNLDWSNSNNDFSAASTDQAEVRITFNEPISVGQTFFMYFGNSSATISTVGLVDSIKGTPSTFDFGDNSPSSHIGKIWVYQKSIGGAINWLTALFWKATAQTNAIYGDLPDSNGSPVFDYTSQNSSRNALDLDINGNSQKCGVWTPTVSWSGSSTDTILTNLDVNSSLYSTFYNSVRWAFANANGVDVCDPPLSDLTTGFAPLQFIEENIVFDEYRYGYPGQSGLWEEKGSNGTWAYIGGNSANTPDWAATTRTKKVTFYESYTLGSFNASGSNTQEIFEAAEIYLVDSLTVDGVTLTVSAGDVLSVQNRFDYRNYNGSTLPKVEMSSELDNSGAVHYAQIAPTNASLLVKVRYDLAITKQGWHHFYSPIRTTLGDVTFLQDGASSQMNFIYSGSACNVYKWIEQGTVNNTLWDQSVSGDSLNIEPITAFFFANQVPCKMRIEGFLVVNNQDTVLTNSAYNTNSNGTSILGYGAPSWNSHVQNNAGWNFYGNPYLSWMSTKAIGDFYSTQSNSINNTVYLWQSYYGNIINNEHYYSSNGSGDVQADYVNPFQGFFMAYNNANGGNSGLAHGKKVRSNSGGSSTIIHKQDASTKIGLRLKSAGIDAGRLYLSPRTDMSILSKDFKNDGVYGSSLLNFFAIMFDSTYYSIKVTPELTDGYTFSLVSILPGHGSVASIENHENFPVGMGSYLYDRYTGTVWNLNLGPYNFLNDTTMQDYRFEWFVGESTVSLPEEFKEKAQFGWHLNGQSITLTSELTDYIGNIRVTNLTGQVLYKSRGQVNGFELPEFPITGYLVVTIDRSASFLIPSMK